MYPGVGVFKMEKFWQSSHYYIFTLNRVHCALHVFITVFTRDVFLSQIHIEMGTALDEATRKLDMWKSVNPTESLQNLKATRPLLQVEPTRLLFRVVRRLTIFFLEYRSSSPVPC